jgi:DNA-directed RNA polymerase beta subunit
MGRITSDMVVKVVGTKADGSEVERKAEFKQFDILPIPIVVGSPTLDPTSGLDDEAKMAIGEDPLDPGGYPIAGGEWGVEHNEALKYNEPRTVNNDYKGEDSRLEILGKVDNTIGNSGRNVIRMMKSGAITVEINHNQVREFHIPIFAMFRLLGVSTHKRMEDLILHAYGSAIAFNVKTKLRKSFTAKYKHFPAIHQQTSLDELKHYIIKTIPELNKLAPTGVFEANKSVWYSHLRRNIDSYFLPNVGVKTKDRAKKAEMFGYYIWRMMMVNAGVHPPSSRDSEITKRNERSGQRIIKMLKTSLSNMAMQPMFKSIRSALLNIPFENIDLTNLISNANDPIRKVKTLVQFITSATASHISVGNRSKPIVNRLSTISLDGSNLNNISKLRQISKPRSGKTSKLADREHDKRKWDKDSLGHKCPVQTQVSGNIGLTSQQSITSNIVKATSIPMLELELKKDIESGLIVANTDKSKTILRGLTSVTINSTFKFVGYTDRPHYLADKYRYLRRTGVVDSHTTVKWDRTNDMMVLYCDGDRSMRPMIIVQNNYGDSYTKQFHDEWKYPPTNFEQWSAVRQSHMKDLRSGKITVFDLVKQGLVEFVDPDEQEGNCLIAKSPKYLSTKRHDHRNRYSHVEMPSSIYGLPALMATNTNHNPGTRNTFYTQHCRQAASLYNSAWRKRRDKGISIVENNQMSPVYSLGNMLGMRSAGWVVSYILMCNPYNVEDGSEFSQMVSDKITTVYISVISSELGNSEEFAVPSETNATRKAHANFELVDHNTNMAEVGKMVTKNHVLIAKMDNIVTSEATTKKDVSTLYGSKEPALVFKTRTYRNSSDILVHEVTLLKIRKPKCGIKHSTRSGQKTVCCINSHPSRIVRNEDGGVPNISANLFCIPTRMTVSQIDEAVLTNIYTKLCSRVDATAHGGLDMYKLPEMLKKLGMREDCTKIIYNPHTGIMIKTPVFWGMILIQNLQKYPEDKSYSVAKGPTNNLTHQPVKGRNRDGGLRFGEMERDALAANGAAITAERMLRNNSNPETIYICRNCESRATVNVKYGVTCNNCKDKVDPIAIKTTRSSHVCLNEVETTGIQFKFKV